MNPTETQYKLEAQAQVPLYKHSATGVIIWRRAIELASSRYRSDEGTLLFHYTTKGNFMAICCAAYLTPELWSALKDIDGCVHGLSEEPDQLDTKEIEAKASDGNGASMSVRPVASGIPPRSCIVAKLKYPRQQKQQTRECISCKRKSAASIGEMSRIVCPEEAACLKLAASKSEQRLLRILEARKAALGAEHPETLIASNDLAALIAALLAALGQTCEAEKLYRTSAKGLEAQLGPKNLDTLYCQSKLAQVLKTRGYAQEAEQLLRKVVRGMKEKLGAQHPDTLCNCAALASVMEVLGRAQEAEPVQNKALEGFKARLGESHPDTIESAMGLASIYSARGKHEMAEPLLQQVLEWRDARQDRSSIHLKLGHLHPDTLTTLERSAETAMVLGRLKQAEQYHLKIIQLRQSSLGYDHLETLQAMSNLAYMYKMLGQLDKAEPLYRRVLASHENHLGPSHNVTAASMANLAGLLKEKGRLEESEVLYRRALERLHHDTLQTVNDLASLLRLKGAYDEAQLLYERALAGRKALLSSFIERPGQELYRHVVAGRERRLGKEHPDTLRSISNLACLLEFKGDTQTAHTMQNSAYKGLQKRLGEDHAETLTCMNNLASLLITLQQFGEAERLCRRTLKKREEIFGTDHRDTLTSVNNLAYLLKAKKMFADAEYYYRRALDGFTRVLGPDHQDTLHTVYSLATLLEAMGRFSEAEPMTRQALEGFRSKLGADHPDTLRSVLHFAAMLQAKKRFQEAEDLCQEVHDRFQQEFGLDHPDTMTAEEYLANTLEEEGRMDEAMKLRRNVMESRERVFGPLHWDTLWSLDRLSHLLLATGHIAEAEVKQRQAVERRRQKLGTDHVETLRSSRILAEYLKLQDSNQKLEEAHQLLQKTKKDDQQLLGVDHSETIKCMQTLADVLASMGELTKAEEEYREVLELLSKTEVRTAQLRMAHRFMNVLAALANGTTALYQSNILRERQRGRCPPLAPSAGSHLTDFMPAAEAARAKEILARVDEDENKDGATCASAFHTRLVDTCSSRFRTEVFQVRYQQVDGQVRHLIGLRDFTDQQSLARKATDEICEPEVPKPAETAHSPDEERKHDFEDLLTLLEVDLDCMQVSSASSSLAWMAGKDLGEVFSSDSAELFQRARPEVLLLETQRTLKNKTLHFGNLKLRCGDSYHTIAGAMEPMRSTSRLRMALCFQMPASLGFAIKARGTPSSGSSADSCRLNDLSL
eukprot:g458.t1